MVNWRASKETWTMVNEDEKGVSRSRRVVRPLSLTISSVRLMEVIL